MTKSQQEATRRLHTAEQDFLWSYNWNLIAPGIWSHARVNVTMGKADAVIWTKSHPELGW